MRPQGLSPAERLKRHVDFRATYRAKRSAADDRLIVYVRPNGLAFSRLGLSVARRFGSAPARNRFKRLVREAFRLHKRELPAGFDIIVLPRRHLDLTLDEAYDSLKTLTGKLGGGV